MRLKINWTPWLGFLLSIISFISYFLVFARFPVTRDVPWASFFLFGVATAMFYIGLRRAFARQPVYGGKITGPVLALLSLCVMAAFSFVIFVAARQLPQSHGSPQVGQKAPDFTLTDTNGKSVSLAELLASPIPVSEIKAATSSLMTPPAIPGGPPKGVLLIFYRGYW